VGAPYRECGSPDISARERNVRAYPYLIGKPRDHTDTAKDIEHEPSRDAMASEEWPILPAELRRRQARALYEIEMPFREEGLSCFVYDEEKDLFRFPDGRFAYSRTHADIKLLGERGY
jgi:hypothetical protein